MTASQRKKLEEFAAGDRPLNRAIAAALAELTAKAGPPPPAAVVQLLDGWHGFERYEEAVEFLRRCVERDATLIRIDEPWTWHPARAAEGEARDGMAEPV